MHLSRLSAFAFAAVLFVIARALAGDVAAPLIGNTFTVTEEGGEPVVLKFRADGTYSRDDATGTWEEKDGQICMTADGSGETHCEPLEAGHKPGDTWQQENADGGTVTMALTAGQ